MQKGSILAVIIIVFVAIIGMSTCSAESDYEKNVRSGFDKWTNGDYGSMSNDERDAVSNFLDWANDH